MHLSRRAMLVVGVLIGGAVGATAFSVLPVARAASGATRWEHSCLKRSISMSVIEEELNQLGAEGWELATVDSTNGVYCMKRVHP